MSALLDAALDRARREEAEAADRAAAEAYQRHAAARRWRVRGPLRAQDGRAVWQVVRDLMPRDACAGLIVDCEAITLGGAEKRATELNAAAGWGPAR